MAITRPLLRRGLERGFGRLGEVRGVFLDLSSRWSLQLSVFKCSLLVCLLNGTGTTSMSSLELECTVAVRGRGTSELESRTELDFFLLRCETFLECRWLLELSQLLPPKEGDLELWLFTLDLV